MARPEECQWPRRQLDAGVFEQLMDAIGLARAFLDQRLAIAGEIAQVANRCRGHEASPATVPPGISGNTTLTGKDLPPLNAQYQPDWMSPFPDAKGEFLFQFLRIEVGSKYTIPNGKQ